MGKKRVVIYARCSTKRDQSPESQLHALRNYCKSRGWTIAEEIVDHGFTGTNPNRPGFKKLIRLARTREIDCVVIVKLDRLFRSLQNLVSTIQELEELKVEFVSVKDQIDCTTAAGKLFFHLLAAFSEFEASLIRERVLLGLDVAVAKGKTLGRPKSKHDTQIIELRDKGLSYRKIRQELGCSNSVITRVLAARKSVGEKSR